MIYGIPLTKELHEQFAKLGLEAEDNGFETMYSGSANFQPGYCGVELTSFGEGSDLLLSDLKLKPTNEDIAEATKRWNELPKKIKKLCAGKSDVYIVWSTS